MKPLRACTRHPLSTLLLTVVVLVVAATAWAQDKDNQPSAPDKSSGCGIGSGIGEVLNVGGGVSAPRIIHESRITYSKEARKAKLEGVVVLGIVVGRDGVPCDIHILRSVGMGLDEEAMKAVTKWRFDPALKNGQAVAVKINVEVTFRLY